MNCIGMGSFSWCYSVNHPQYVCKVLPLRQKAGHDDKMHNQTLEREITVHFSLHHSHIVELYEVRRGRHHLFLLMERCDGDTLSALVNRQTRLTVTDARHFGLQLMQAIDYLHRQARILHRDIKPSNILMSKDQRHLKLADFGLCSSPVLCHGVALKTNVFCGTPNYMAPELLADTNGTEAVDVWAFAVTLFFMLTGRHPFEGTSVRETYLRIRGIHYHLQDEEREWMGVDAVDLFKQSFQTNVANRLTLSQMVKHPFFANGVLLSAPSSSRSASSLSLVSSTSQTAQSSIITTG
jgi:polo-like kinase 1